MTPQELAAALEAAFQQAREMDASLGERLAYIARVVRSLSPPFAEAVDRLVERLTQAGAGGSAPDPGTWPPSERSSSCASASATVLSRQYGHQ